MKFSKFILFLVLISLPLALATTVTTDKTSYASGEIVKISGTCDGASKSVALQAAIGVNSVWFKQTTAGSDKAFSIDFTPPQTGKFTLLAACNGETAKSINFNVGITAAPDIPPDNKSPGSSSGSPSSCTPLFECSALSYCNASLKQTQTCTDTKFCKPYYVNVKNCTVCEESWVCSIWSSCNYGTQDRTCTDLHLCGTTVKKPAEQQPCQQFTASAPPSQEYTPPSTYPTTGQEATPPVVTGETTTVWEDYKLYIIGLGAFILLAFITVILILLLRKPKQVYNLDELKEWVVKERQMGTSDADIRTILAQSTGWKEPEIQRAFGELGA
ncbi:hypothetical protein HZC30_02665 [Candidatus Woesearchaeota archaeon]|nr:hypothetical protein [Candidatus Woesearchaeota archaeon]